MSINIGSSEVINIYIGGSAATAVYIGDTQIWGAGGKDYSKEYFTLKALESGEFGWPVDNVEYSLNDGTWTAWDSASTLSVNSGDAVRFKSSINTTYDSKTITSTGRFDVEGNSMSLFYGDNFQNQTTLPSRDNNLTSLFSGNIYLVNAENMILPATTLKYCCYQNMFRGCSSLTEAPVLPATTLGANCYAYMFAGCTSLTTAPELPATTTVGGCYQYMFNGCTSLTEAPVLPATTLTTNCYNSMFQGCTSLTTAPELSASACAGTCYSNMFNGCTSLNYLKCLLQDKSCPSCVWGILQNVSATGTFVKAAGVEWSRGAGGVPNNWTVIDV